MKVLNISSVIILMCFVSCAIMQKNNDNGTYHIEKFSSTNQTPVVFGTVFSHETKKPLQAGVVKLDGKITVEIDQYGKYKFNPNIGGHRFVSISVPYQQVTTQRIKINKKDLLGLIFI